MSDDPYAPAPPPYAAQNPYAPPAALDAQATGPIRGHHPLLKWFYLGAAVVTLGLYIAMNVAQVSFYLDHLDAFARAGGKPPSPILEDTATQVLFALYMTSAIAMGIVGLTWLGLAWAALPPQYRVTKSGRAMSPAAVVGFMFIPCFSLYWMFPANVGLCDALDYLLGYYNSPRRAPRGLAIAACVCYIVPCTTLLVAPILFFIMMWKIDDVMKEILPRLAAEARA